MTVVNNICLPSYYEGKITTDDIRPKKSILVLVFYPYDFTIVCPTEILAISAAKDEFLKNDSEVVFVSTDSVYSHQAWAMTDQSEKGLKDGVHWPMLSDFNKELCSSLNMLNEDGSSMRGTVILDKEMRIRHYSYNDNKIGRRVKELLRLVKAIKHTDESGEMCLVDWDN